MSEPVRVHPTNTAPEDRIKALAAQIRTIIETEIVPERQAKMEAMAITEIYAADDTAGVRLGVYGEATS